MRRTVTGALTFGALLLLASVGPVSAECFPPPEQFPPMRYAFTATVVDYAYRSEPNTPERVWDLDMEIERKYRGQLPVRLKASGWEAGCDFNGVEVRAGERLFIAAEDVEVSDPRLISGRILIWREVGGGLWEFYADALQDGALGYPAAAVRADTTAEILALLGNLRAPDTATSAKTIAGGRASAAPLLVALFILAFLTATVWRGPTRRPAEQRPRAVGVEHDLHR